MDGAMNDSADAGNQPRVVTHSNDASRGADNIDDISGPRACANSVPMRVECANGDGNTLSKAEFFGPFGAKVPGNFVAGLVFSLELSANAFQQWINGNEEFF